MTTLSDRKLPRLRSSLDTLLPNYEALYCMYVHSWIDIPNDFSRKLLSVLTRMRIWARRAIQMVENDRLFRPGGAGYLRAREDFQVRAGQRRATRRYRPY